MRNVENHCHVELSVWSRNHTAPPVACFATVWCHLDALPAKQGRWIRYTETLTLQSKQTHTTYITCLNIKGDCKWCTLWCNNFYWADPRPVYGQDLSETQNSSDKSSKIHIFSRIIMQNMKLKIIYMECRIWGSHDSGYEEYYVLGYNAV
jgi:hypothetical protein